MTVELGTPISIDCAVLPPARPDTNATVSWRNSAGAIVSNSAELRIARAMSTQSGEYYCVTNYDGCMNEKSAVINVNYGMYEIPGKLFEVFEYPTSEYKINDDLIDINMLNIMLNLMFLLNLINRKNICIHL